MKLKTIIDEITEILVGLLRSTLIEIRLRGILGVLIRVPTYLRYRKVRSYSNNVDKFTYIWKKNLWGSTESVSGPGSTLYNTQNLRSQLPILFKKFSIGSIVDALCGDFNWMKHVIPESGITYTGIDVVDNLIVENKIKYSNSFINFYQADLIMEVCPRSDLLISRDFLFHLSQEDIFKFLNNFLSSETNLLLSTTHKMGLFVNSDIKTGDFRRIDLFAHPYHFSCEPLFSFDDYTLGDFPREMCLWSRQQVIEVVVGARCSLKCVTPDS